MRRRELQPSVAVDRGYWSFGVVGLTAWNRRRFFEQVVEEQNTAAIRDLCRALQQHKLLESPHLHVRSLALEVERAGLALRLLG